MRRLTLLLMVTVALGGCARMSRARSAQYAPPPDDQRGAPNSSEGSSERDSGRAPARDSEGELGRDGDRGPAGDAGEKARLRSGSAERGNQATRPSEGAVSCATSSNSERLIDAGTGSLIRASAIRDANAENGPSELLLGGQPSPAQTELYAAAECLSKALRLSPDSYDAHLHLGVTYLLLAKESYTTPKGDNPTKAKKVPGPNWGLYIEAAKVQLGLAYVLRTGPYEPLYYLAELAVEENDEAKANEFLRPLEENGYKLAPVYALRGFMAERGGNMADAERLYQRALQSGWPRTTFMYALDRLREREEQKKKGK